MPIFLLIICALIIILMVKLRKERNEANTGGWILDQDLDGKGKLIYRNKQLGISCKPDVLERNRIIEDKSATVGDAPRYGDVLQVAAQILATGKRQSQLRYSNKTFDLPRDSAIMQSAMKRVRDLAPLMRRHLNSRIVPRGNAGVKKCMKCQFRTSCPDSR
jgi:hypothetical protein